MLLFRGTYPEPASGPGQVIILDMDEMDGGNLGYGARKQKTKLKMN